MGKPCTECEKSLHNCYPNMSSAQKAVVQRKVVKIIKRHIETQSLNVENHLFNGTSCYINILEFFGNGESARMFVEEFDQRLLMKNQSDHVNLYEIDKKVAVWAGMYEFVNQQRRDVKNHSGVLNIIPVPLPLNKFLANVPIRFDAIYLDFCGMLSTDSSLAIESAVKHLDQRGILVVNAQRNNDGLVRNMAKNIEMYIANANGFCRHSVSWNYHNENTVGLGYRTMVFKPKNYDVRLTGRLELGTESGIMGTM